jgi:hypothetical protein
MFELVNGYICFNCTDVANAKKNINPAHPKGEDASPAQIKTASNARAADANRSIILGGSLIDPGPAGGGSAGTGSATPVGAKLNLSV